METMATSEESASRTDDVIGFLKTYITGSITETLAELSIGISKEKCVEFTSHILDSKIAKAKDIVKSSINASGLSSDKLDTTFDSIDRLAQRFRHLNNHRGYAFLLVSLPLDRNVQIGPETKYATVTEKHMRDEQTGQFAEENKDCCGTLDKHDSNACFETVHNEDQLVQALNDFLGKMTEPKFDTKELYIICNGHGGDDGIITLRDPPHAFMDDLLLRMQEFRSYQQKQLKVVLPELYIVFAQCYSYTLNWEVALHYGHITDVIWLTEATTEKQWTWNVRDKRTGKIIHEELMQLAKLGPETFCSLSKKRRPDKMEVS